MGSSKFTHPTPASFPSIPSSWVSVWPKVVPGIQCPQCREHMFLHGCKGTPHQPHMKSRICPHGCWSWRIRGSDLWAIADGGEPRGQGGTCLLLASTGLSWNDRAPGQTDSCQGNAPVGNGHSVQGRSGRAQPTGSEKR